jgi:hypothetical protein
VVNGGDLPDGALHRRQNPLRLGFVRDLDVFALVLRELRFKGGRLPGGEQGVDGPVFLGDEGADFLFALHDQPQRHRLHPAGRKSAAHLVPQQRRNFVPHQPVQHAPRLLRVH